MVCMRAPREKRLTNSRNHALEFADESLLSVLQRKVLICFSGVKRLRNRLLPVLFPTVRLSREVDSSAEKYPQQEIRVYPYQLRLTFYEVILSLDDISVLHSL